MFLEETKKREDTLLQKKPNLYWTGPSVKVI